MRLLSLVVLVSAGLVGTSDAALTEVHGITASANAWDTRADGYGCAPRGCVAENVLDDSVEDASRWSCRANFMQEYVEDAVFTPCKLTFVFDEPRDIMEIRMALWRGDDRVRSVNVWVDGALVSTITSSGKTLKYEAYQLIAPQATTIMLQYDDSLTDWLSVTGVKFMAESALEESPSSPAPTDPDYVGCFSDTVGDRLLFTVEIDQALTPEACAATCAEDNKYFYGLQQGNECWCAGCDLTERDTNSNYDRHGVGRCSTPCAGDSTQMCGGDMEISLYQYATCLTTPSPTPPIPASDCPSASTPASLEIILTWENTYGMELFVMEPGGKNVSHNYIRLGDVGMAGKLRTENNGDPGAQTYVLLNGLSVDSDAVLGDYTVWGKYAQDDALYTITARSGSELLWVVGGTVGKNGETPEFVATVTDYAESDCNIPAYGKCPGESISATGLPPCTACPEGLWAQSGTTFCTDAALRGLGLPEALANAMTEDAVGGFAGPGDVDIDGEIILGWNQMFVLDEEDAGTLHVSGRFFRDDPDATIPASIALFLYLENEDTPDDFVRGRAEIDASTGTFTATFTDIPPKYSKLYLSFVVMDLADAAGPDERVQNSVFSLNVINEGCSKAMRVTLEWDGNDDINLWVTEPGGTRLSSYTESKIGDFGYLNIRNGGGWTAGNPDLGFEGGREEYVVFSGQTGDAMLGEYTFSVKPSYSPSGVTWTLTALVGDAVVWSETGSFESSSDWFNDMFYSSSQATDSFLDDDSIVSSDGSAGPTDTGSADRRLSTTTFEDFTYDYYTSFSSPREYFDDDFSSYSSSYSDDFYPQSDVFTVTLDTYNAAGC